MRVIIAGRRMSMTVTRVGMPVSSITVRMAVMTTAVLEDENAHKVDQQSQNGNDEKSLMFDFWRFEKSFHSFRKDVKCDEDQKDSICKPGQNLSTHISI